MSIIIYDSNKTSLSPISFINDLQNQRAIRDLDVKSSEFGNQLGVLFTKVNNLLGIKETILDINKQDIKDLITTFYKGLSLEEIDYAFKLERFGKLDTRIKHYQLFNSSYVDDVLKKYVQWKEFKIKHNIINNKPTYESMTDKEKIEIENNAVRNQYNYFLENREIDESRFYVYDILDKKGLMPTDLEYKNGVKKDAIDILTSEFSNIKASSREEKKEINSVIENLKSGKSSKIVTKCKVLALWDYFKSLEKDDSKLNNFKELFNV